MMAEIVMQSATVMPRRDVPPDVYFGDLEPDELMVVETAVVQWSNPHGAKYMRSVSWAYPEKGFM